MVVWEALDALSHEFELCGLDATTTVVALFDADANNEWVALVRAALARVGADAAEVRSVHSRAPVSSVDDPGLIRTIIEAVDVVVDGRSAPMTRPRSVGPTAGARVLTLGAGSVQPHHYPPHANLARRVKALGSLLDRSSRLILRDDTGTSLRVDIAGATIDFDHGIVDDTTPHAVYPAGWVRLTPGRGAVDGDVVVMPGDTIPAGRRMVSSPVRLRIEDDRIVSIDGESSDADALRSLLEQADDPNGYAIASISCGMNPPLDPLEPFDPRLLDRAIARLTAGVVGVGFGENLLADRPCGQTIIAALRGRTVEVDDGAVVHRGALQGDLAPDVYEIGG